MSVDHISRGEAAKRLLNDPILIEAFDVIERDVMEAFFACPARDDEGRRQIQTTLRLSRQLKGVLQGAIERGRLEMHELKEKEESIAKRAAMGVRRLF
jgi:hypothetical protein